MYESASRQEIVDTEHLRLLRIGYFVSAGTSAIFIPIGLLYAAMGAFMGSMFARVPAAASSPAPDVMGWVFGGFGLAFAAIGGVLTGLKVLTGIRLGQRRSRVLCLVVAAFSFMEMPWGTLLGVFTFTVLSRPGVRHAFDQGG